MRPSAQDCADAVGTLMTAVAAQAPTGVTLAVESEVQRLDETTGQLIGFETITAPSNKVGAMTGSFSGASGAVIIWNTAGVRNGRRIQGRTFLVPLAGAAYGPDGTLGSGTQSSLQTAATAFADSITAPVVWARPSVSGASDGVIASITQARIPDMAAVLRSRRD